MLCCVILFISLTTDSFPFFGLADLQRRSFRIDMINNQFVRDGNPFRIIGGSFHYFRALPETWQRKLRTMRAAGLNVVTTYVEWSLHNPKYGNYTWDGMADLERFIRLAAQEDLYVILRPGPYICAERDFVSLRFAPQQQWRMPRFPFIQQTSWCWCCAHEIKTIFLCRYFMQCSGWTPVLAFGQISIDQTTHQRCK